MIKSNSTYITNNILTDKSEQIHYQDSNIPYYIMRTMGKVSHTNGVMHWHQDIELSICIHNVLKMEVGKTHYDCKEGDGLFVNSKVIHGGYNIHVDHISIRLNPILLCTNEYMERNFVLPVINNPELKSLYLSKDVDWQKKIIDLATELYMFDSQKAEGMPLLIERYFFEIWYLLYVNMPKQKKLAKPESIHMSQLKDMMGFIQENYEQKIKLKDIAQSGNVSESTCNAIFTSLMHVSPITYLLSYRLSVSQTLLRITNDPITEVAEKTGFNGASYFTEQFRNAFGMTPREYRKKSRDGTLSSNMTTNIEKEK